MGFALYIFFITLHYLRPIEAYAPELVIYRPMLMLMLVILLVALGQILRTREIAASGQNVRLLLAFACVVVVSVVSTGWIGGGLKAFVDLAPSMLMFVFAVVFVKSKLRLKVVCTLFVACMMVASLFGILAYHTGYMADKLLISQVENNQELWRIRYLGTLRDPNDFGQELVVALSLLPLLHRHRSLLRNLFVIGLPAAIMLYAIFLTHSRGALLGLAAVIFVQIQRILGAARSGIILTVIMFSLIALNFTGGRAYTANEESAGGRIDAWSEGLQMLKYRPIFGVGYGQFTEHHSYTAHNSFVLCFAETGIVGYYIWLGMILIVYKQLTRAKELTADGTIGHRWAITLRSSMVGFFTCSFFLSRAYAPGLFALLGIAVSVWHCTCSDVQTEHLKKMTAPVEWRGITALVLLGSIFAIYIVVTMKNAIIGRSI